MLILFIAKGRLYIHTILLEKGIVPVELDRLMDMFEGEDEWTGIICTFTRKDGNLYFSF